MELWVRSQNKEALIKVDGLRTYNTEISGKSVYEIEDCKYNSLGTYKSKERLLEVLDEIENILNDGYVLGKEKYDETSGCYYEPQNNVYKMPKE